MTDPESTARLDKLEAQIAALNEAVTTRTSALNATSEELVGNHIIICYCYCVGPTVVHECNQITTLASSGVTRFAGLG
jgi:hypothetical protein